MNVQQQQRIDAAGRQSIVANKSWTSTNREVLAYVAGDRSTFWKAILSFIQLENQAELESVEPSVAAYEAILSRAFVTLIEDGTIKLVEPISSLAEAALNTLRTSTGIGAPSVPQPVPVKSAEEQYEESVIRLWETLPSEHFRARLAADKKLRSTFQRLSETDRIVSGVVKKSSAPAERELAADQRLVKIDPDRYIRHMSDGQITCTNSRSEALVFSLSEAQQLVTKLRRNRFPQATVSE